MSTDRIAVIGDIHGHHDELKDALVRLGMDADTCRLPSDLHVVQLGDLIHRGPASHQVLELVDTIVRRQPDQWTQLIGNHEAQYLYEEIFQWDDPLDLRDQELLHGWQQDGLIHGAAAMTTEAGYEALLTHAGVCHQVWNVLLSQPRSAKEAASRICAGPQHEVPWFWEPGEMLTGVPNRFAGPIWASASSEVYPSWLMAERSGAVAPFNQVHGHSSPYMWPSPWSEGEYRRMDSTVRERIHPNEQKRHTTTLVAGSTIVGIDPGFGKRAPGRWQPLVCTGEVNQVSPYTPEEMDWLVSA